MNSALLRQEKLELYSPIVIANSYGEYEDDWKFEGTVRAGLLTQSMQRLVDEDRVVFDRSRTFIVRSYVNIEDNWRIKWNDKWWQIISITPNRYHNDKEIVVDIVYE